MTSGNFVESAREFLKKTISEADSDPYGVVEHTEIVERWAKFILKHHPEADSEIVLIGVWLHDCGHYPLDGKDHAVVGEKRAREFMQGNGFPSEVIERVAHCVRAHRCNDVLPETIEAKILACADSASHFIDFAYLDIIMKNKLSGKTYSPVDKLERDFRDVSGFPEVSKMLEKLYSDWKALLDSFKEVNDSV